MRGRLGRIALAAALALALAAALAAGALFWRLSRGPLPLGFLDATVQRAMNENLAASGSPLRLRSDGIVLERASGSGHPALRLRNVRLMDGSGRILAHAPRASFGVDGMALLSGRVRLRTLELIGPRIILRRKASGTFEVGFATAAASKEARRDSKEPATRTADLFDLDSLFRLIEEQIFAPPKASRTTLSSLETIRVTGAAISFYDELNDVLWYAPRADLVFRKVPYGFALLLAGDVSNGGRPWRTELTASFRRKARTFTVAARVFDVYPMDVARNIFAVSRLARLDLPLSGHVEAEFTASGELLKASAELTAGRGRVSFPGYIAREARIDEGLVRFDYEPETGDVLISPSTVMINGAPAEISGRISPRSNDEGRIRALRIALDLGRGNLARPRRKGELIIDHMRFLGTALLDEARLDVEDLSLRAGAGRIRLRGRFSGEKEGVGIYIGGRAANLSATLIKKLWPPVLAPRARKWVRENILSGTVTSGTFQLGIPAAVMLAAIRRHAPIPDAMADIRFAVSDVAFRYFRDLPLVEKASGSARLRGDSFDLKLTTASSALPSGARLSLHGGTMRMRKLAAPVTPTTIDLDLSARVRAFLEYLDLPPLKLLEPIGIRPEHAAGKARARVRLSMPLSRGMKGAQIVTVASAEVKEGSLRGAVEGLDMDGGNLEVSYREKRVQVRGRARIAGLPARLEWAQDLGRPGSDLVLAVTLGDAWRKKHGLDLSPWMRGPVPLRARIRLDSRKVSRARIEADLARVSMRLPALKWSRPPTAGTKARFDLDLTKPGLVRIAGLKLRGKGLRVEGRLTMKPQKEEWDATFSRFEIGPDNRLALGLKKAPGRMDIAAAGDSFDARPLIADFFSASSGNAAAASAMAGKGSGARGASAASGTPARIRVNLNLRRVLAERGESIYDVRGFLELLSGRLLRASLTGMLASGKPLSVQVMPASAGRRRLRVISADAGSVLRAVGLYSKVRGGEMDFSALLADPARGGVERGLLVIRRFVVRNERNLSKIRRRGARPGPRKGLFFKKLVLPFSTDAGFVRIGNALVKSDEIGATANGLIRKRDKAMDIGGTIIPAYGVNAAIGKVPILGDLLTGGHGQGVFGMTYAIRGTMRRPKFIVNPLSAIAPGVLRGLFEVGGGTVNPDGTPKRPPQPKKRRSRSNVVGGG